MNGFNVRHDFSCFASTFVEDLVMIDTSRRLCASRAHNLIEFDEVMNDERTSSLVSPGLGEFLVSWFYLGILSPKHW
jgi:hypothetical protein